MSAITVIYFVSLLVVLGAVIDIVRQPAYLMNRNRKLAWGLGAVVGWLFFGIVGAAVAGVYLIAVRRRLNSLR